MTMSGDQIKACCTKNGFTYDLDKFKKRLLMIHFDNNTNFYNTLQPVKDEKGNIIKDAKGVTKVEPCNGYIEDVDFDNELIWFKEVNQTTYIDTFKAFNEIQGLTFWREDIDETDVYARKVPDWAQLKNL